jgi:hypothetical protein
MYIIKEANEFESILADNDFQEMNQFLIDDYGFKKAWTRTNRFICYTNKKNVRFDVYLDPKKPNRVITLRAEELDKKTLLNNHALIGKFPGGKAPFPAFSFSSPEVLVKKLENWKL